MPASSVPGIRLCDRTLEENSQSGPAQLGRNDLISEDREVEPLGPNRGIPLFASNGSLDEISRVSRKHFFEVDSEVKEKYYMEDGMPQDAENLEALAVVSSIFEIGFDFTAFQGRMDVTETGLFIKDERQSTLTSISTRIRVPRSTRQDRPATRFDKVEPCQRQDTTRFDLSGTRQDLCWLNGKVFADDLVTDEAHLFAYSRETLSRLRRDKDATRHDKTRQRSCATRSDKINLVNLVCDKAGLVQDKGGYCLFRLVPGGRE